MADVRVTSGQNGRLLHCFFWFWLLNGGGGREGQLVHTPTNCSLLTYWSSVCVCVSPAHLRGKHLVCPVQCQHGTVGPLQEVAADTRRARRASTPNHSQPLPTTPNHSIPPAAHTKQQTHAHGMLQLYTCTHHTMTGGGGHINNCSDGFCIYKNLGTRLGRNL